MLQGLFNKLKVTVSQLVECKYTYEKDVAVWKYLHLTYMIIFRETVPLIVTKLVWNIKLNQDTILVICAYVDNR